MNNKQAQSTPLLAKKWSFSTAFRSFEILI